MNKLMEFLKAKSLQIAITSVSVCLVVGVSAGAIIHSNNKKLETVLNELSNSSITESITESSSETTTESTTESSTNVSTTVKKKITTTTTTTEPAGDRTIQYLAEYERITNEYEKKRAELEEQTQLYVSYTLRPFDGTPDEYESYSLAEKEMNEHNSKVAEKNTEAEKAKEKIDKLDTEYEKDIENLKREYGIIE